MSNQQARNKPLPRETIKAIIEFARYHPEETQKKIAQKFNTSELTVGNLIRKTKKELGANFYLVPVKETKSKIQLVKEFFKKDLDNYYSLEDVAKACKIKRTRANEIILLLEKDGYSFSRKEHENNSHQYRFNGLEGEVNTEKPRTFSSAFALMGGA